MLSYMEYYNVILEIFDLDQSVKLDIENRNSIKKIFHLIWDTKSNYNSFLNTWISIPIQKKWKVQMFNQKQTQESVISMTLLSKNSIRFFDVFSNSLDLSYFFDLFDFHLRQNPILFVFSRIFSFARKFYGNFLTNPEQTCWFL